MPIPSRFSLAMSPLLEAEVLQQIASLTTF